MAVLHESALTNLRQTLYRLRMALDEGQTGAADALLTVDRQAVRPHLEHWSVDALAFAGLLDACERHAHADLSRCDACLARLDQAVALYHGELLAGLSLPDAPPFEEWLLFQRGRLQHQFLHALVRLAAAYEARGDYASALQHAERLLACDPYQEAVHRQVMRLLARRGLTKEALAHYESCRRILRDELGAAPDAETTAIYQQIKVGALGKAEAANPPAPMRRLQGTGTIQTIQTVQTVQTIQTVQTVQAVPSVSSVSSCRL